MHNINKLLDIIGDFSYAIAGRTISFSGFLMSKNDQISLRGRLSAKEARLLEHKTSLQIWGMVDGKPITLLHTVLCAGQGLYGEEYGSVTFSPAEIVVGRCYLGSAKVIQMSTTIPALNHMFLSSPLKQSHSFSKENPAVLNYAYPDDIETDDKYGHLRLYQTFQEKWNWDSIHYDILSSIEYRFKEPLDIMDALSKIAAARNLFTFFANYYLPLEVIEFADIESKGDCERVLADCYLFLNHFEDIPELHEPFLITTSCFKDSFSDIWNKWLEMYETVAAPIPTLFYEIICNRSTRVNRLLNFAQALEVYSYRYRNENAKQLALREDPPKEGNEVQIRLKHRLKDILIDIETYLGMSEEHIDRLSVAFSRMRNFYTHYNDHRYAEPSYEEVFAACHVLGYILLAVVYKALGIPDDGIKNCKNRVQFELFNEDIATLIDYSTKKPVK